MPIMLKANWSTGVFNLLLHIYEEIPLNLRNANGDIPTPLEFVLSSPS